MKADRCPLDPCRSGQPPVPHAERHGETTVMVERAVLEQAIREIAGHRCLQDVVGERCPEAWATAMGGKLTADYQRSRWCVTCIAREALDLLRKAASNGE